MLHGNEYQTHVYTDVLLQANDVLPIKTFPSFEVDPLAAITASLSKLEENERAVIQFLVRPVYESWYGKAQKYAAQLQSGGSFSGLAKALISGTEDSGPKQLSPVEQTRIKAAEEKSQKLAYEMKIRIIYEGNVSSVEANMRLQAIIASFKQFNSNNLNGFTAKKFHTFTTGINQLSNRAFTGTGFVCILRKSPVYSICPTPMWKPRFYSGRQPKQPNHRLTCRLSLARAMIPHRLVLWQSLTSGVATRHSVYRGATADVTCILSVRLVLVSLACLSF
jgi:hypothetical protein